MKRAVVLTRLAEGEGFIWKEHLTENCVDASFGCSGTRYNDRIPSEQETINPAVTALVQSAL